MRIFENYTGNAMLNNALMTIESLAHLSDVSEINPKVLQDLYESSDLSAINQRLKSYTMVFSLNNPLVNPAKKAGNAGERTYDRLMTAIMSSFENKGKSICEISGLRFEKTFEDFYKEVLEQQKQELRATISDPNELKKEIDKIDKTDTSLNRTWFPLIGGLGSDAQALPQAKYAVKIHPICIAILQFLPLSAVLYKGGVLLVDSSNFLLSKEMISTNVKAVRDKIQFHSADKSVENIRDFNKGSYLLRALAILSEKEQFDETYSDLNLWSFSNSGTGASCEIDRVPNQLIRKLQKLHRNAVISEELKSVLASDHMYKFLESLEDGKEWYGLFRAVFGSGKKRVEYEGMSPEFLEAYFNAIQSSKSIQYAKYIAWLVQKYKNKKTEQLLLKTDGWNDPEFKIELFRILAEATKESNWSFANQIDILDNADNLPVRNSFWSLHRLIHFYSYKNIFLSDLPGASINDSRVSKAASLLIAIIQGSSDKNRLLKSLLSDSDYRKTSFEAVIIDAAGEHELPLENMIETFYDDDFQFSKYGMVELLRLYFSQPNQEQLSVKIWDSILNHSALFEEWKNKITGFVDDYQQYYFNRYQNPVTQKPPMGKFSKVITTLIHPRENFTGLLRQAIYNTNQYFIDEKLATVDKWTIEDLLTNPLGESSPGMSRLAIKFIMKTHIKDLQQQLLIQNN